MYTVEICPSNLKYDKKMTELKPNQKYQNYKNTLYIANGTSCSKFLKYFFKAIKSYCLKKSVEIIS